MKSILLGMAIGDAVGVPVEFQSREQRIKDPVIDLATRYEQRYTGTK